MPFKFLPDFKMALSSAKSEVWILGSFIVGKSFIIMMKRSGAMTLPCGTPFSIGLDVESSAPSLTLIVLSVKQFVTQLYMLPNNFNFLSL
jgi:hypothetical protein